MVEEKGLANRVLVRSAYLVAFGLILHDMPEGFAMANAYIASPDLGVFVGLAVALHNLPEEFAMSVPVVAIRSKSLLFLSGNGPQRTGLLAARPCHFSDRLDKNKALQTVLWVETGRISKVPE